MPIYNSHISIPNFRRLGYHIKSTKTNSTVSLFNSEHSGEMTRSLPKRKFTQKAKRDSPLSSKSSLKSVGAGSAISMKIESPPLVLYGSPKDSTGALLSGLIHLKNEGGKVWESFTMTMEVETYYKRPVHWTCAGCVSTVDVLKRWTFIAAPTGSGNGLLSYPFSFLLAGNLPAANDNALTRISYSLSAIAISVDGDELRFRHPLNVERSILRASDRHSVRIFPPTNLSATVKFPTVIHPGGDFPLDIRLDGVVNQEKATRWRLRKASWRIDESSRAISPACKNHSAKHSITGSGVPHSDVRTISSGEVKRGWKSDFDLADGKVELQVIAGIPVHSNAACQLDAPNSTTVDHTLIVEMIVAEEHKAGPGNLMTPTGAARVLRMQFKLVVTGRSGLGISWDEEAPPIYEDVPASPPDYGMPDANPSLSYADLPPLSACSTAESLNR